MAETVHLGLPLLEASQAQKHVTHNEALLLLDAAIQLSVVSRAIANPPALPEEGDRYLVAAAPTGNAVGCTSIPTTFINVRRAPCPDNRNMTRACDCSLHDAMPLSLLASAAS